MIQKRLTSLCLVILLLSFTFSSVFGRNPIRRTFFQDVYPNAAGTQLDDLPSNAGHCGVCHFDFDGGGTRNPYGLSIEIGIGNGLSNLEAIQAVDGEDADGDGFTNNTEITSLVFNNTPTFPGLNAANVGQIVNVTPGDVTPYLTPQGSTDTTPPDVTVISPNGGEAFDANTTQMVTYTATDASGISHVNFYISDDGGSTWKPVGRNEASTGSFSWFVPNRPGATLLMVEAVDNAANAGFDESDGTFDIIQTPPGVVPTTLRDIDMPGTQPLEGAILESPQDCAVCHGNYSAANEPWENWRGSMMGQTMRDPLFLATMVIAEQDAPSAGDLCLRCHTPGGWQEGRSVDTSGGMITENDRWGVQCDFCHRVVDFDYVSGVSPAEDAPVLNNINPLPLQYGNGQFINDPAPWRRGPRADAQADHQFLESPIHGECDICGTCHDVSNPVFVRVGTYDYAPNTFDQEHPDTDVRNMFPVERTFSEWSVSEYATTGVYAPQFAGTKADGIVSTCQDCHMRDISGKAASGGPNRSDIALHDLTGGNTFVPDILPDYYPTEVNVAALQAGKDRARNMLQLAATLQVTPNSSGLSVRVTNETGHKLPSGYPEGRRIWLSVEAVDSGDNVVFQSGHYDMTTGDLEHDAQLKLYEIHPGTSPSLAAALGVPGGPGFHFVLSDSVFWDNRIPPRGYTLAAFEQIQSAPVGYSYADGQYWDDTEYTLPTSATSATVTLYYQSTSKEYITFLRDENHTDNQGQQLYDAWVAQGMSPPEVMAETTLTVNVTVAVPEGSPPVPFGLQPAVPNPFLSQASISFAVDAPGRVQLNIYDLNGRRVRNLVDEQMRPSEYKMIWDGRNDFGVPVAAGMYFIRLQTERRTDTQRIVRLQ